MTGATRKLEDVTTPALPANTSKGPLVALAGTTTSNWLSETLVKSASVGRMLLNSTIVALVKPEPLMVMTLPSWPDAGEKPVIARLHAAAGKANQSIPAVNRREIK
jgi:hypothetical protein